MAAMRWWMMAILAATLAAPPGLEGAARAASDPALEPEEDIGATTGESELIAALQTRLKELGLYRGRIDGRPGLMLELAIRDVQRSLGLAVDGEASTELLARLEGLTGQANALRQRLDELRTTQAREARELLASAPATRDLLEGPSGPIEVPTPPCPETIDLACVVGIALGALPQVAEPDRRDWVAAELARALTRAGDETTARRLVALIEDPRSIITALRDMAIALAEAGRAGDATAAADIVPAPTVRLEARVGAAMALLELGRGAEAARLVGPVIEELEVAALGGTGVVLLTSAATVMGADGDADAEARLLDRAESLARAIANSDDRDLVLGTLAQALAATGALERAGALVELIAVDGRRAPLYARLAAAAAASGEWRAAEDLIPRVAAPRYRAVAEAELAAAYGRAGLTDQGLLALAAAEATLEAMTPGFARSFAGASAARAAGALGDFARAATLAEAVGDNRLRAQAMAALAVLTADDAATAEPFARAAFAAAGKVIDPVERASARAELMGLGYGFEPWRAIVEDARDETNPWPRLRALAALAAIAARAIPPVE